MNMMRHEREIFGDMNGYVLATDIEPEEVKIGDEVSLVNKNCEFEYDNITGKFQNDLLYYIICDLEFIESDLSEYQVDKSNNGGSYAYATAIIKKIKDITY